MQYGTYVSVYSILQLVAMQCTVTMNPLTMYIIIFGSLFNIAERLTAGTCMLLQFTSGGVLCGTLPEAARALERRKRPFLASSQSQLTRSCIMDAGTCTLRMRGVIPVV